MEWLRNLSPVQQSALGVLFFGLLATMGACMNFSPHIPDDHEDSMIEEMIEHKIEQETGLKIDLTKDSPE